ncbi:baculovirus repeated ORF D [Helicoverpa armigera nucleopolyhedrovirus]|nr:baculovirus repeated ORF D [Helicoverpa armigera nucleopolyhedrovirus]
MYLVNRKCKLGEVWITEIEENRFLCSGHGVAEALGYKCPRRALYDHVKPQWRKTWAEIKGVLNQHSLVTSSDSIELPLNWQPNTLFITEAGIYALIMRSKLPAAEEFQSWLFEEVLPELRRTGKYSIENRRQSSTDNSTEIVSYDQKLANVQMEALQLKLQLSEANIKIAEWNTNMSEMKRNYEQQMSEYKEREFKMQLQMKDMAHQANMSMFQFAANALLAKDNIDENHRLRQTLEKISNRVVPVLTKQPEKEEYITGYERIVNGKRRIRMCRSQLYAIEMQDKVAKRYRDTLCTPKRFKPSPRYAWLCDSTKFLQLKCSNSVMVWCKIRADEPHVFYGLRYTNKLCTEMEVLDETELRAKYRADVEMCQRNKTVNTKLIEEFKALDLIDEDDCVAKCLTQSVDAKDRINAIVENIVEKMAKELVPSTPQRRHSNAGDVYSAQQVVHAMNNCQNYFVKNVCNVRFYDEPNIIPGNVPAIENVTTQKDITSATEATTSTNL